MSLSNPEQIGVAEQVAMYQILSPALKSSIDFLDQYNWFGALRPNKIPTPKMRLSQTGSPTLDVFISNAFDQTSLKPTINCSAFLDNALNPTFSNMFFYHWNVGFETEVSFNIAFFNDSQQHFRVMVGLSEQRSFQHSRVSNAEFSSRGVTVGQNYHGVDFSRLNFDKTYQLVGRMMTEWPKLDRLTEAARISMPHGGIMLNDILERVQQGLYSQDHTISFAG